MNEKEIIDYFRSNIFGSLGAYEGWKMMIGSRSEVIVSPAMAKRYTEIQNYHHQFFPSVERAFLFQFVIQVLHSFDRRDDSASLYKIDQQGTQKFVSENSVVIDALRGARNKMFAHKDISLSNVTSIEIPSMEALDMFFKNLIGFYNHLTKKMSNSSTIFDNAYEIKRDMEHLFMNLFRGEAMRLKEINIEWDWVQNTKKASDIL